MTKKDELKSEDKNKSIAHKNEKEVKGHADTIEEKLKKSEEKLLRALAETENQRKRFEKEIKEAFDFGGFNFAKETLSLLDNLQRAKISMKNDETLQKNNDQMSIKVLPINIGGESLELSKKFFDELNINKLSLFIGNGAEIAKKYKLRGLPTTLFIDKNGYEFARVIGSIDFNNEEFLKWLKNQN